MEFSVRIEPTDITELQTALRQQFELKLTRLPFNTTQLDLSGFLTQIKAKSCFIPRDRQYRLRPYAYINFDNINDYDNAFNSQQKFKIAFYFGSLLEFNIVTHVVPQITRFSHVIIALVPILSNLYMIDSNRLNIDLNLSHLNRAFHEIMSQIINPNVPPILTLFKIEIITK